MVTHDIPESISMSDKIIILTKRPAKINEILDIKFADIDVRTPLAARNSPEFREYFNTIWKELDVYV